MQRINFSISSRPDIFGGYGNDRIRLLESVISGPSRRMLEGNNSATVTNYQINITSGTGHDDIFVFNTGEGTRMIIDAGMDDDIITLRGLGGNTDVYGGNGSYISFCRQPIWTR